MEEDNNNNTKDILINSAAEDAVILKAKVSHNRVRLVNKVLCSEKKLICEDCDKIIRSKTALTNHKESTHLEIKGIEITEPELSKVK